jgi:hypothetical protein
MGIAQVKIRRGSTVVELDAAQVLKVTDMVVSGTLRGSGKIASVVSYIEGAEVEFGAGGLPLAAFPVIYGLTVPSPTGTAPAQKITLDVKANQALPYFEVIGRSLGDDGGDVWIYIPKCKLTSGTEINMQDGANFTAPNMKAIALPDATQMPYRIIVNETAGDVAFPTA